MILSKDTDIEAHFGATITILWFCFKVPYIAEKLWIKYDKNVIPNKHLANVNIYLFFI